MNFLLERIWKRLKVLNLAQYADLVRLPVVSVLPRSDHHALLHVREAPGQFLEAFLTQRAHCAVVLRFYRSCPVDIMEQCDLSEKYPWA